ncbi:lysine 2,3-aminomutase [Kitasatospora sp. NPDC093806]|uniref:KamA family radical SAM protein n=1 Tax=Kitasatospora sp. NPDC093806 TaxID=3155075 RepID=UPI00342E10E2
MRTVRDQHVNDDSTGGPRPRLRAVPGHRLAGLPQLAGADERLRHEIAVVAAVLPFKVNNHVLEELIDWRRVPDDPMYRLTFPHRDMLPPELFDRISGLIAAGAPRARLAEAVAAARRALNPHPGGQLEENIPELDGRPVPGLQHKYRETVLLFPAQGQSCHAYCGYCFRWAQFVGEPDLRQSLPGPATALAYLRAHREVSDVLITGGDPLIMSTDRLAGYVEPLLGPGTEHLRTIRLGTKALAWWPHRFTTDPDADGLLRLFERVVAAGRQVAVMAHVSHPRELAGEAVRAAVARIRSTGAVIRAQAPLIRHVNDDPAVWAALWRDAVALGIVPYYLFVERDTGASSYFEVPLARAVTVYQEAFRQVSGLERTARGPVMSAGPGKVCVDGVAEIAGERVFVCRFLQAREPDRVGLPFFARYDERATWFDQLRPASFERRPWFAAEPSFVEEPALV